MSGLNLTVKYASTWEGILVTRHRVLILHFYLSGFLRDSVAEIYT